MSVISPFRIVGVSSIIALLFIVPAQGQEEAPAPNDTVAAEREVLLERVRVVPESGTPVIASEIFVAVDAVGDTLHVPGIAHLSARAIIAPIQEELVARGGRVEIGVDKGGARFTLVAAPDLWHEAMRQLIVALFRDPPADAAVRSERESIANELRVREPNPTDVVTRITDQVVFGDDHPWGMPTAGIAETVERLTTDEVDTYLRTHFLPERALVAVVGPVDPDEIRSFLRPFLGEDERLRTEVESFEPEEEPVRAEYPFITTWITASYLLPPDADFEAIRLMAVLITDRFDFGPRSREVYNIRGQVRTFGHGGELRLEIVVPPEHADSWEDRLVTAVRDLGRNVLSPTDFQRAYRQYRGRRLFELLLPEERAAAHIASLRLLHASGVSDDPLPAEISSERLREAAGRLPEPVRVQVGPFSRPGEEDEA